MGKAENEAREKARRDKNVKKWKQNTDRWAKWKAEQKEKKEVKEETKFTLPEKYEGDHSVRKIYMEQLGGNAGFYGGGGAGDHSVAASPARAAPRAAPPRQRQQATAPQAPMRVSPPTAAPTPVSPAAVRPGTGSAPIPSGAPSSTTTFGQASGPTSAADKFSSAEAGQSASKIIPTPKPVAAAPTPTPPPVAAPSAPEPQASSRDTTTSTAASGLEGRPKVKQFIQGAAQKYLGGQSGGVQGLLKGFLNR